MHELAHRNLKKKKQFTNLANMKVVADVIDEICIAPASDIDKIRWGVSHGERQQVPFTAHICIRQK
jgi:DICT domain-containing protein